MYLSFQFHMNKKKRVMWEIRNGLKKSFCWRSNLSNDDIIILDLFQVLQWVWILDARSENRCGK